jgi:hypothetical protein
MTLSRSERRWLLMVFDAVVPSGATERLPKGARDVPMGRFVDDLFAHAPLHFCLGVRACLWIVMLSPWFVLRRFTTFAGLSRGERIRLLEEFGKSERYTIREAPLLFKTVACLGYCGLPEIQTRVGISPVDKKPPSWARKSLPRASTAP